jgi:hypothetical protein
MVGTGKGDPGFGVPLSGIYLGLVPLFGVRLLQYSQQWQATDVFRAAPLAGPMALCEGVRRAVLLLLTLPMLALVTLIVWFMRGSFTELLLILPGLIALPAFSLVPMIGGQGVPLSLPTDAAKAAGRSLNMILVTAVAFALSGLTSVAWSGGWFWWLVLGELAVVGTVYTILRFHIKNCGWPAETT